MGNYRLTESAEDDLIGIHQWGVRTYGEVQADKYYDALFDRIEQIAEEPYLYPAVGSIPTKVMEWTG
ncbi:MAG: type II toxin-antitoxin system RelE/ParE family toxin [Chloroflexi bacterium]|nr:type II toxin-antitoxin system RelE/ParE family toxin [Chloroflexota bacterium]